MTVAMYATVWLSLSLFAVGALGMGRERDWGWGASALGALLLVVHIAIAMGVRHDWSHASAISATAAQTNAMYGLDWGGGLFVNYIFAAVWIGELVARRYAPAWFATRSPAFVWTLRAFYFVIIVNAAVVFAAGWRRLLGAVVVALLVVSWRGQTPASSR